MNFARTSLPQHRNNPAQCRPTYQRILDQHDPLALEQLRDRVKFYLDPEMANRRARLDKGPADVMAPHQRHLERHPSLFGEAERRSVTGVRYWNDDIGVGGTFARKRPPLLLAHGIDVAPVKQTIGPREVYVLENAAAAGRGRERMQRTYALVRDHQHLARLDFTQIFGTD